MTGKEVVSQLQKERKADHHFIKWWRKENDFADYELIDNFLRDAKPDQEFAGFSLLTMDEMWRALKNMIPDQLDLEKRTRAGDVVVWTRSEKKGGKKIQECPFIPESLMTIFDVVTRGNPIDS